MAWWGAAMRPRSVTAVNPHSLSAVTGRSPASTARRTLSIFTTDPRLSVSETQPNRAISKLHMHRNKAVALLHTSTARLVVRHSIAALLQFRAFYRNLNLAVFRFAHLNLTYPLRANITISLCRVLDFTNYWAGRPEKGKPMLNRTIATFAAASILCIACAATEAMAYRGGYRGGGVGVGGYHGGAYRGGAYRGAYVRRGVGAAAVGAAAVGAAVAAPYYNSGYYNSAACGYYPNPPCN